MKYLLLLGLLLTSCTIVNAEGSIKNVHYKLTKDGAHSSLEVSADSSKCPILDVESNIDGNTARVTAVCKTILK